MRLRKECEHDRYERHDFFNTEGWEGPNGLERHAPIISCPGGEEPTIEDLVAVLERLGVVTAHGASEWPTTPWLTDVALSQRIRDRQEVGLD